MKRFGTAALVLLSVLVSNARAQRGGGGRGGGGGDSGGNDDSSTSKPAQFYGMCVDQSVWYISQNGVDGDYAVVSSERRRLSVDLSADGWSTITGFQVETITENTVLKVTCSHSGPRMLENNGLFIGSITYDGQDYYTSDPLRDSLWEMVDATSGILDATVYCPKAGVSAAEHDPCLAWNPSGQEIDEPERGAQMDWGDGREHINSNAYFVWNNRAENEITFQFDFGRLFGSEGCCYGGDSKCDTDDQATCEKFSSRKGCEWKVGQTDCTFMPEPGCCYGANSKCNTDDQTTCENNARRAGCEWRSGESADCSPEPGCCAMGDENNRNAQKCLALDDDISCNKMAKRAGCEWRSGEDAVCDAIDTTLPPTPSPVDDIRFNDKYEGGGQDLHGASVECYGAASCSTNRHSHAVEIRSEDYVKCHGYKSCDGASVTAKGDIDCGGELGCASYEYNCEDEGAQQNLQTDGNVFCGGYRSCAWNYNVRSEAANVFCNGEESCIFSPGGVNAATNKVKCMGERACAGSVVWGNGGISCTGYEACFDVYLSSALVDCDGSRSCAEAVFGYNEQVNIAGFEGAVDSRFIFAENIVASGANALSGSLITAGSEGLSLTLSGDNAGSGATVARCHLYQCSFICVGTACRGLVVECGNECTFADADGNDLDCLSRSGQLVGDTYCPDLAEDLQSMADLEMLDETLTAEQALEQRIALSAHNNGNSDVDWCAEDPYNAPANPTMLCETAHECENDDLEDLDSVTCAGAMSCPFGEFQDNKAVSCEGVEGCAQADFLRNVDVGCRAMLSCDRVTWINADDADEHTGVDCTAHSACANTVQPMPELGFQSWNCRGFQSCSEAQVLNVNVCSGAKSCQRIDIGYSEGDLRCGGESSCDSAVMRKVENLYCAGHKSCIDVSLQTIERLYCDGKQSCSTLYARNGVPHTVYARGQESLSKANLLSLDANGRALKALDIYAYGVDAMRDAQIDCVDGTVCTLHCFNDACKGIKLFACYPGSTCNIECDGDSGSLSCVHGLTISRREMDAVAAVAVQLSEGQHTLVNEPLVMLVGAGAVMMILGAVFFLYGQPRKDAYQAL